MRKIKLKQRITYCNQNNNKTKTRNMEEFIMNTYLIPVTESFGYEYCYYALVHENTLEDAHLIAKEIPEIKDYDHMVCKDTSEYIKYSQELYIPKQFFHKSQKNDIMSLVFKNTKGFEYMAYFQVNWNNYTQELSSMAAKEQWSNETYQNNKILANYMVKTYDKLSSERNIIIGNDYALFNTGLFTEYYDPIYAFQSGKDIQFLTAYELNRLNIKERPERANYFSHPELLLFDWHYPIDVQYKHILDDEHNKDRLPDEFLRSSNMVTILNGAIDTMKKRVSANYKLAIPQYYDGKIQLLLPLCLMSDDKPDVAIAVTKKETCYQGHTCLTLDMAYNNARLIAKPESNWLMAENITEE